MRCSRDAPPYDGETPVSVAIKHINAGAPMPSELNPNIPGGLEQITMHAMCANLDERYSSATEMLYDLEEFRKDPTILFQFRGAPTATAAASAGSEVVKRPRIQEKTPAERRMEERARRKKLEEERRRARRRRIRNLCLIAAGVLALLLGIILLAGSCSKRDVEMVTVPDFTDMVFADLAGSDYPGLKLVEDSKEYSDEFEAGHIISQSPKADTKVEEGSKILLVVSLGKQSANMPDLLEMKASEAEKLLKGMDLDLNIRRESVYDDVVEENRIIRTEPNEGVALSKGQTIVLFVSRGSETPKVEVPKVEGEALTRAIALLTKAKLEYKKTYVNSDKPKDTVLSQSVKAGEKVAEGTIIDLEISRGPEEETPPEEDDKPEEENPEDKPPEDTPPAPPAEEQPADPISTKIYTVTVEDHSEAVSVDVICAPTGEVCGETQWLEPGENAINIALTGSGEITYNVYVNGSFYTTFTMNFS